MPLHIFGNASKNWPHATDLLKLPEFWNRLPFSRDWKLVWDNTTLWICNTVKTVIAYEINVIVVVDNNRQKTLAFCQCGTGVSTFPLRVSLFSCFRQVYVRKRVFFRKNISLRAVFHIWVCNQKLFGSYRENYSNRKQSNSNICPMSPNPTWSVSAFRCRTNQNSSLSMARVGGVKNYRYGDSENLKLYCYCHSY